jgi:hypothetical protein
MRLRTLSFCSGPLALALLAAPPVAQAYHLKAPWRGDSLPSGHFMHSTFTHSNAYPCANDPTKDCGIDLLGRRFDAVAGTWTDSKTMTGPEVDGNATSMEDYVAYGMPLYAPVDGEVIACWSNMPNELLGGAEPPECVALEPEKRCMAGGNHVLIRTADDVLVFIAHMKPDSIPPELCPGKANLELPRPTVDGVNAFCAIPGMRAVREDTLITGPLPVVHRGDLIGAVGNSGASTHPHTHIEVRDFIFDENDDICYEYEEWEFEEAWVQTRDGGALPTALGWDRLVGEQPDGGGGVKMIWPDPQGPRMDELDIAAGTEPALALTPSGGVAAFRNAANNLQAVGFTFDGLDHFDLGAGDEDGAILDVDLARINAVDAHVVAAVRTGLGQLRLVPYFMQADGDLVKGTPRATTITAKLIAATPAPTHSGVVVAFKNNGNDLTVSDFKTALAGETLSLTAGGTSSTADDIVDVDIATVVLGRGVGEISGAWKGVVTAERRTDNFVWLRSFTVNSTGTSVTPADVAIVKEREFDVAFTASDVDITVTGGFGGREFLVVSTRLSPGDGLRVQSWEISSTGQLALVEQIDGGPVTQLSSARVGQQDAMVGARLTGGGLTTLSFNVGSDGALRRVGTRDAGTIDALALDGRVDQEDAVVLAPLTATGEVRLIHYRTNYSPFL